MVKREMWILGLALVTVLLVGIPAWAQEAPASNYITSIPSTAPVSKAAGGVETKDAILPPFAIPAPPFDPAIAWREGWLCRSAGPAEVQGFRVQCNNATFLDFHIADCCLPGDHWQLKGKAWDVNPNTGVTTSPGPVPVFSVPGRAYNYGGTGWNPGGLDAYVECTYLNGVNVFLADSFVWFSSDGNCVVTPDPVVQRIDRAP
jgi:hypothetical protein